MKLIQLQEAAKYAWYHVSSQGDLGATVTLRPRPVTGLSMTDESDVPRVCVAPTVKQCLFSIMAEEFWEVVSYFEDDLVVYGTNERPDAPADESVEDRALTDEHWFLRPVELHRVGTLDKRGLAHRLVRYL